MLNKNIRKSNNGERVRYAGIANRSEREYTAVGNMEKIKSKKKFAAKND